MCSPILKHLMPVHFLQVILNHEKKKKNRLKKRKAWREKIHWPFIFGKYPSGVSALYLGEGCVTVIFLIMWEATSKKAAVWFHPSGNLSICESSQDSWISKLRNRGQRGLLYYFGSERMFHIYQWHSESALPIT